MLVIINHALNVQVQKNLHLWPLLLYTKISIDQPSSLQGNRKITTVCYFILVKVEGGIVVVLAITM